MSDEEHVLSVDQIPVPAGHGQTLDISKALAFLVPHLKALQEADEEAFDLISQLEEKVNKIAKFLDIEDEL